MRRRRPRFRVAAVFALALVAAMTLVVLTRDPAPVAVEGAAQPEALAGIARKNEAAALNAAVRLEARSEASAEAVDAARDRNEATASEPAGE